MNAPTLLVVGLGAALAVAACGSDAGGTGGSGTPGETVCKDDCDAVLAAGCSQETECQANCLESYGKCPDEVQAIADCGPTYQCDAVGKPFPMGCDAEQQAFSDCYNQ